MKRPVIFVVESGGLCGGVRVIFEYANRLRARDWHVEIYSLDQTRPNWFPLNPSIPWFQFKNYEHLVGHLSKRDAIKIATWWKTAFPVAEASKPGEGFYLVQDVETSYYLSPMIQEQVLTSYDLGLVNFTTSRWVEENLDSDVHYVGIGLDISLYRALNIRRQLNAVLSLSRPQRLKGWTDHLELYRKFFFTRSFNLYSFGTANVHPPFSSALPSGISDEELVRWYNRVGFFVSTSEHEGFSLTLLEAMACGAIVVATNANGNMQFCEHGSNCIIVDKGDCQGIVDNCLGLLEDSDLLIMLQANGLETAKEWDWEPVIDRLESLYLES